MAREGKDIGPKGPIRTLREREGLAIKPERALKTFGPESMQFFSELLLVTLQLEYFLCKEMPGIRFVVFFLVTFSPRRRSIGS